MTITSKTRRAAVVATCAAMTAVLGLFAATPAQAQDVASLVPAAGNAPALGTTEAAAGCEFFVSIFAAGLWQHWCAPITVYEGTGTGANIYGWPVTEIVPLASGRVWFHQYTDGSGWSKCFQGDFPNETIPIPSQYQRPGNIVLSTNTNAC